MPKFTPNPDALYLCDNGACLCGDHLGSSARTTGRDISGQRIQHLTPALVAAFVADTEAMGNRMEPTCEHCGKHADDAEKFAATIASVATMSAAEVDALFVPPPTRKPRARIRS